MKVAICFSGAIRNFDDCIGSTLKYFINNFNDPDIFLHMWTFTDKNKDKDIKYNFKWRKDNSSIDKIIKVLKPKKYVIEEYTGTSEDLIIEKSGIDVNKFDTDQKRNYGFNCCSMYWKILKSFELAEEYGLQNGIKYDLVIRARLDFIWEDYIKPTDFADLVDNKIYLISDRYATCSKLITNDKFFAGDFDTMKKMCRIFDCLKRYQDHGIMIEGQTINETHIKQNNFQVMWIGHSKTYYKFMGRHKVKTNNIKVLVDSDDFFGCSGSNTDLSNELVYKLVDVGYTVSCPNIQIANYNKTTDRFVDLMEKPDIVITVCNDNDYPSIIISKEQKQKKLIFSDDLVKLISLNFNILTDFTQSLIQNFDSTKTEQFELNKLSQVNTVEPKEIVRYKHMDHGYYLCEYYDGFDNNNHLILFDKKNIKVPRDSFKIVNLVKYYQDGFLPIN
jgi:hypothetical protein